MHNFCLRSFLLSSLLISFAMSAGAQTAVEPGAPNKAQALSTARGLMQQRVWAVSCPYKKENRESLDVIGMVIVPSLKLKREELTVIEKTTGDAALRALSSNKEATCKNREAQFELVLKLMTMHGGVTAKTATPPSPPAPGATEAPADSR